MDIFEVWEEQADVQNVIVKKKYGSEGEKESKSNWQTAAGWFEGGMSRKEKEMLGQQKKEGNAGLSVSARK